MKIDQELPPKYESHPGILVERGLEGLHCSTFIFQTFNHSFAKKTRNHLTSKKRRRLRKHVEWKPVEVFGGTSPWKVFNLIWKISKHNWRVPSSLRSPGCEKGKGVEPWGIPKDSVWEDWGFTLGKIRGITTPPSESYPILK